MDNSIYERILNGELSFKVEDSCPVATKDIAVNLKNRKTAIDSAMYGPLNPSEPNEDYWEKIGEEWDVDVPSAKKQLCGNCVMFIVTPEMKDCISSGVTGGERPDEWAAIDSAGELGYCEAFDFKCASKRTCRAWVVGGPITEEKENRVEEKAAKGGQENQISSWMNSMNDDEVDSLFPENEEMTDEEAKWMFGDEAESFKQSLMERRKMRGGYASLDMEQKGKSASKEDSLSFLDSKEAEFSDYIDSLDDDEFDAKFPDDSDETVNEVKFLFGVGVAFGRRTLMNRRKRRKKKETEGQFSTKGAGNSQLRDPKGGLTAAGRAHFNKTEGSNLKPGVKGPADTPEKMRRKGSFLTRFFTNPRGPMKDEKGRPTRLALSAAAWGEPVPQTVEAAKKLADKGQSLLGRYRRYKESSKGKKSLESYDFFVKKLGAPVGQQGGTVSSRSGGTVGGSSGQTNYNPSARDADGDGNVQEGTEFMRAAAPRKDDTTDRRRRNAPRKDDTTDRRRRNAPPKDDTTDRRRRNAPRTRGASDSPANTTSRTWQTDTGSADTRERGIIRENLEKMGFDGEAFRKFIDAESRKLKPGQKTNWNPGRLPNGGKIAGDGTYIPPDMVREDDKKASDYYRERREARANASRPKITREGDVVPDKNRDRIPPKKTTTRTGSADSMERNAPKAPRTGTADSMERNAPRTPRSGTADSMERTSSTSRRPDVQVPTTSDGTIIPNKNTDRRKPKPKGPTPLEDFI